MAHEPASRPPRPRESVDCSGRASFAFRGVTTRPEEPVRWDEWICPSCSKKNFLTNKNCRQCQGLPNEQQKLAGAGGSARHANIPPPGPAGPTGLTAPSPTTGSELKQQVSQLEAMQELGDQELLTNIEDKLRHAQAAKAESRPQGAQKIWGKRNSRSNAPKKMWTVPKTTRMRQRHKAEAENRVEKLRELVAQDPEMTQQAPDDLTALTQPTDQLSAQMRPDQVPQAAGPLLAQLQHGLRASAATRSRTASRSRSTSSGSTPLCSRKQRRRQSSTCWHHDTMQHQRTSGTHHLCRQDRVPTRKSGEAKNPGPRSGPVTHITWANVMLTMGLHTVYDRGWLDRSETATFRRACRWLLFSTCFGTPPLVQEEAGSEDSFMQPDHEAAREAGASPDPSWHSDSDESDATNTTASTPRKSAQYDYRGTRVGEALNPGPTTPPSHSMESAIETTLCAGCKDGTTLRLRV